MAIELLATVAELKHNASIIDGNETDAYLEGLLAAASELVADYVQGNTKDEDDAVHARVKQAVLILATDWYDNRGREEKGVGADIDGIGLLPYHVQYLIYSLRKPVVL